MEHAVFHVQISVVYVGWFELFRFSRYRDMHHLLPFVILVAQSFYFFKNVLLVDILIKTEFVYKSVKCVELNDMN